MRSSKTGVPSANKRYMLTIGVLHVVDWSDAGAPSRVWGSRLVLHATWYTCRDRSGHGLSQWETTLHCNVVSYWLSPYSEWSLMSYTVYVSVHQRAVWCNNWISQGHQDDCLTVRGSVECCQFDSLQHPILMAVLSPCKILRLKNCAMLIIKDTALATELFFLTTCPICLDFVRVLRLDNDLGCNRNEFCMSSGSRLSPKSKHNTNWDGAGAVYVP